MATGQPVELTPTTHPVLGPGLTIYADRRQAWGSLFLALAFFAVALLGIVLGTGDLSGQSAGTGGIELPPILGLAEIAGALVIGAWSVRSAWLAIGRIRNPATLVVGRDGFEFRTGDGPVGWDEVESVGDPGSPDERPRALRVQLKDRAEYARRHSLSLFGLLLSRANQGDLVLGHDTIMPIAAVQALMRKRLAEFSGDGRSTAAIPAAAVSRRPKRRPSPKR